MGSSKQVEHPSPFANLFRRLRKCSIRYIFVHIVLFYHEFRLVNPINSTVNMVRFSKPLRYFYWIVNWIINRRSFDKCQILLIIIIILLCKIISDIQDQNHQQQNRVTQQFEQSSVDQIGKFLICWHFVGGISSLTFLIGNICQNHPRSLSWNLTFNLCYI